MKAFHIFAILCAVSIASPASAEQSVTNQNPIRIGEMMSYTGGPNFAEHYKRGWQLAVEEANASGGIAGRQIEVISRDDKADPGEAVRLAEELIQRDSVDVLFGAGFDHVGLAVGNFANKNQIPFVKMWGGKCEKVGSPENKYWFITIPCIDVYGALYARQVAKLPYKRWAIVSPNYEFGRNVANAFKTELKRLRPDVEFVAERWPVVGKIKAQEEIRTLIEAKPEAVFNQLFESDLTQYVRMSEKLGFNVFHIGNYVGDSMAIHQLGAAFPKGWFTAGAPENPGDHPASGFYAKFEKRYGFKPSLTSMEGYRAMLFLLEGLRRAGSTDHEKVAEALVGTTIHGPFGTETMRKDHQPRQGYWLGYTDRIDGKGVFVNWKWYSAREVFPNDVEAK